MEQTKTTRGLMAPAQSCLQSILLDGLCADAPLPLRQKYNHLVRPNLVRVHYSQLS